MQSTGKQRLVQMKVQMFVVGMLSANCYVVQNERTKVGIVIDPGFDSISEAEYILNYIEEQKLSLNFVIDTHGHDDHIAGNRILQKKYFVPICIHKNDAAAVEGSSPASVPANVILDEGDSIEFGGESLAVMNTPGHTPGSICLLGEELVFTGDTLFAGGIGRTDFFGGSDRDMKLSLKRLARLPEVMVVYPGHGPATTIGREKRLNPFLRQL